MGSLHWSLSRSRNKMKILLMLTLTVAAVIDATPLQPDNDNNLESPLDRTRRSVNGCPYQVIVGGDEDPTKGPYKLHKEKFGTYTRREGEINGHDWYRKDDYAIWYSGTGWLVGVEGSLGSHRHSFGTPDDDDCPHEPAYTWNYYVDAIGDFVDAGTSLSIWSGD